MSQAIQRHSNILLFGYMKPIIGNYFRFADHVEFHLSLNKQYQMNIKHDS